MNLLVVEDDKMIREGICEFLSEFGYKTYQAEDGKQAISIFENNEINLAILDIQLPYINGLEVLKKIRETSDIPAIMLTAFSDEEYKINAFTSLADGYIEKPFSLPVLKVRIESLIKKCYGNNETFNYKNTEVNFTSYTAKINGKKVDVNAKELEILKYMIENEGQALTRMQIIDSVWKETDEIPFDRVIDVYIKELRKKLELDCIVTIRNVGYKLERK
ncbi:MAG: response regulator transcription factor [Finegoldia magna]|uniref:response regulator transcription factor n=1 Tax=Finegoldia magna TaxID=1260 RepID=UPI0026EFFB63|nr:response regulator transcription factor [Finegoldia magna]MBS5777054.1 response regulator transcription factor [Finegoldia magna]MDU1832735.1 response regulator transcription factor [Finegoldia magna]MDU2575957.1 response regulator transcription factor [Finegoldia magna]MDU5998864.1 response regulator transcription factor [Finegoldia magna]MDU7479739.1 response regulator transcription factor [Finegoldia magna]